MANGNLLCDSGNSQELCNNLEGWDGEGDGREVQRGGDICVPMADSMLMFGRNQHNSVKQ